MMNTICNRHFTVDVRGGPVDLHCAKPCIPGYDFCEEHAPHPEYLLGKIVNLRAQLEAERDEHGYAEQIRKELEDQIDDMDEQFTTERSARQSAESALVDLQRLLWEKRERHEETRREFTALKEKLDKAQTIEIDPSKTPYSIIVRDGSGLRRMKLVPVEEASNE